MKLIVGLGNPGIKYEKTRHNVGFMMLDKIATTHSLSFQKKDKLKAGIAELQIGDTKIFLAKPNTFMNNSGDSVAAITNFYKIENKNVLVIHDEVDIEFGKIKLSQNSGSAGHNGVESVIEAIGKDITRLRIGIDGRTDRSEVPTEKYVLDKFTQPELATLKKTVFPAAVEQNLLWIKKR